MSLISHVGTGPLLEKARGGTTRCSDTQEEFIAKITKGLLPAQREFVLDTEHLILGFCAGFGAGKTRALTIKALYMAALNPDTVAAVFEPTSILLRDVWMRSFDDALEEFDIEHEFRVSPQPEYKIYTPLGSCVLLCRATETYTVFVVRT